MKLISSKDKQEIKRLIPAFLFGVVMALFMMKWKTWGPPVVFWVGGVWTLIIAILLWHRMGMIYIATSLTTLAIMSFIFSVQYLVTPESTGSWWKIFLPVASFVFIMRVIEKKKNPEKMKKLKEARKKASFLDALLFKNIPKIR